jgi:transcriptional regulator with XRE-family HTH domain
MNEDEEKFLYQSIGNLIRKQRKKTRISQEELADKLGLSRTSIVNIEHGRQHPSVHLLVDLSRILNVNLSYFVNDDTLKDFSNQAVIKKLKRQIGKVGGGVEAEKILAFIQKSSNQ